MVKKSLLVYFLFTGFDLKALSLDKIFRFDDAKSLRSYLKRQNYQTFLKILCKKQKEKKPPLACYEFFLAEDSLCLDLKLKNLNLEILNESLKSKFLTPPCRKHLKKKKKILIYRKKRFFSPRIKKLLDSSKAFPLKKKGCLSI